LSTVNLAVSQAVARRLGRQRPLDQMLESRLIKLGLYADVFCQLLRIRSLDFATFYYSSIDAISHEFFKYYEPAGFPGLPAAQVAEFGDAIPRIYEASDAAVGRILRWVAPGAYVMIVSDHGQRPVQREGEIWYRIRTSKLVEMLEISAKVRATNMGSGVYIRPAAGPAEYAQALAAFRSVVTVDDGRPLFTMREHGPAEAELKVRDDLGAVAGRRVRVGAEELEVADVLDGSERISGEHTETAMFLLAGPGVDGGRTIPRGSVLDIAPTTLALLGLPLARDLDGVMLGTALRPAALAALGVRYVDGYGPPRRATSAPEQIGHDKLESLRELGYVE
jgi:arylsulfatase A-like enzyme